MQVVSSSHGKARGPSDVRTNHMALNSLSSPAAICCWTLSRGSTWPQLELAGVGVLVRNPFTIKFREGTYGKEVLKKQITFPILVKGRGWNVLWKNEKGLWGLMGSGGRVAAPRSLMAV